MKPDVKPVLQALIDALQFKNTSAARLRSLEDSEWGKLLPLCDRAQLTLLLYKLHADDLPDRVRARIDRNWRDNATRNKRWQGLLDEMADALRERSIDFVLLKGPSHAPHLSPDPLLRAFGDIDLWLQPERVHEADSVLRSIGYAPVGSSKGRHLAPLVRPEKWEWRGDCFAPDLPISVDLHYELWDSALECIGGPDERAMWSRCTGGRISTLAKPDLLTFAVLHFVMHLLHGDLRLHRIWEIAYFLHTHTTDVDFWTDWRGLYPEEVLRLQVLTFLLAQLWFDCDIPAPLADELEGLSPEIKLWVKHYGWSPITGLLSPNKDELWLNLSLVESRSARLRILRRRLFPKPESVGNPDIPKGLARAFLLRRIRYHITTLLPSCASGVAWYWRCQQFSGDFVKFLLTSALFDFGEFVFFLLYNLYLLDLGYHEQFIGRIAATLTAGTLAGVFPAAALSTRAGLRTAALVAILGTSAATCLRAILISPPALFTTAFLNGFFMAFWAVAMLPTVAGFTNERKRPLAFSFISALGIGIGSLAGLIGGRLPAALAHLPAFTNPVAAKRGALVGGCLFAALALIPASFTRFPGNAATRSSESHEKSDTFLLFFLLCVFAWMIGTSGFNPFFNVYFATQLHLDAQAIGNVFSLGQLAQVVAILGAPLVLKRFGHIRGIVGMQIATAITLLLLALAHTPVAAGALYIGYVCFHYMSEPCLFSVLMSKVPESVRSRASALNFAVTSIASMLGAFAGGALLAKAGYSTTLCICAAVVILAALLLLLKFRPALNSQATSGAPKIASELERVI